jgi:hypothetical protein
VNCTDRQLRWDASDHGSVVSMSEELRHLGVEVLELVSARATLNFAARPFKRMPTPVRGVCRYKVALLAETRIVAWFLEQRRVRPLQISGAPKRWMNGSPPVYYRIGQIRMLHALF